MKIGSLRTGGLDIGREAQENFSRDRFSFFVFLFSIVAILTQAALLISFWRDFPPQVPIFYSRPWGEDILAPTIVLLLLPVLNLAFLLVNYFVLLFLLMGNLFLSRVIVAFTLIVTLMIVYDLVRIISLLV